MTRPHDHPTPEDLSAYIDGELDRARRHVVEAHVSGCAACRALVDDLETLRLVQGADVPPAVPAGLAAKIGARLDAVAPARRPAPRPRRWMRPAIAAAATIVMGTVVALIVTQQGPERVAPALRAPAAPAGPAASTAPDQAAPQPVAPRKQDKDEERRAPAPAPKSSTAPSSAPASAEEARQRNEVDRLRTLGYVGGRDEAGAPPAQRQVADAKKEAQADAGEPRAVPPPMPPPPPPPPPPSSLPEASAGAAASGTLSRADERATATPGGEVAVPVVLASNALAKGVDAPADAPARPMEQVRAKAATAAPVVWSAPDTDVLWQRLVGFVEGAGGRAERTAAGRTLWVPRDKLPQLMQWLARQGASGVPQNAAPGIRIELRESGRS